MKRRTQDTHPEAEPVLLELWPKASPSRKFSLIVDTTRTLQEFILAGLRLRHPGETPAQLRRRFADAWLGKELAPRAYGSVPDDPQRS